MNLTLNNLHEQRHAIADWAVEKGATCSAPERMRKATDDGDALTVLLDNYGWCKEKGMTCTVLDNLTREQLSPWYVWLLETYCVHGGQPVQRVIDLHKRVVEGGSVSDIEWYSAWAAARNAAGTTATAVAWYASRALFRDAAWAAARNAAREAAWHAARAASRAAATEAARSAIYAKLYTHLLTLQP